MTLVIASADHHFYAHGARAAECVRVHQNIVEIARREQPAVFVSAGDVYERASTPECREQAAAFFAAVADICPVVVVRGNHDRPLDVAWLRRIKARHPIHAIEGAENVIIGDVAVMAVGWPSRSMLRVACGDDVDIDDGARDALGAVLAGLAAELDAAGFDGPRVLAMHAMVDGSVTSTGQPLVGCEFNVDLATLARSRASVGILGHIHAPQEWTIGGVTYAYTGSPYRTAFGEVEDKGVIAWSPGEEIRRIDTGSTRMVLLDVEWHEEHVALPGDVVCPAGFSAFDDDVSGAEVRLRYHVEERYRERAREDAVALREQLLANGAVSVRLDPQVHGVTRQREGAESLAGLTLADKLGRYWDARQVAVSDALSARVSVALGELEAMFPASSRASGGVRLERLRTSGIHPFGEIDLDLSSLPGPLVAVTGGNGAGKSTLMELLPAALYRTAPTRGKIAALAYSRRAFVDATVSIGDDTIAVRQIVDGTTGKGEALVTRDGEPVIADTKVSGYDRWAASNLPAEEVFYSTTFRSQRDRGLAGSTAGERKAVLLRAMGLERLEQMAKEARERSRVASSRADIARARLTDETARGGDVERARADLSMATGDLHIATEREASCREAESVARDALLAAQVAVDAARVTRGERERLTREASALAEELADKRRRVGANEGLLARAEQIRAEASEEAARAERWADDKVAHARAQMEHREAYAELVRLKEAGGAYDAALARRDEVAAKLERAQRNLAEATDAKREAIDVYEEHTRALEAAEEALSSALTSAADVADERVFALRGGITSALSREETWRETLIETLRRDDDVGAQSLDVDALRDRVTVGRKLATAARAEVDRWCAREAEWDKAVGPLEADLAAVVRQIAESERVTEEQLASARNRCDDLILSVEILGSKVAGFTPERKATEELRHLELAEERLADHRASVAALVLRQDEIARSIGSLPAEDAGQFAALDAARSAAQAASQALSEAADRVAECRQRATTADEALRRALSSAETIAALETELASVRDEADTWSLLASSLGRDGLQAMEVDSAAANITATANQLLEESFGSRWRVRVETQRASADGKRQLEGLTVEVLDGRPDTPLSEQWRGIETLSGGEEVPVAEALALALTVYASRAHGVSSTTLIRDESGAALDGDKVVAHVTMLRRAAEMIGADKVLLITHSPDAWELCDSRLVLGGGKVEVG